MIIDWVVFMHMSLLCCCLSLCQKRVGCKEIVPISTLHHGIMRNLIVQQGTNIPLFSRFERIHCCMYVSLMQQKLCRQFYI